MEDVLDGIRAGLSPLTVDMSALIPYPGNPRRGQIAALAEGLTRFGQYKPLVVQASTGRILAGNQTFAAAQRLGWTRIAAGYVDYDDETAARLLAFDNRSNELGYYDGEALADLLCALPDLDGTGYGSDDLAGLLEELREPVGGDQPLEEGPNDREPVIPAGGDADVDEQEVTYRLAVECDTREEEDELLTRYLSEGYPVTRIFGSHRASTSAKIPVRLAATVTAPQEKTESAAGFRIHPSLEFLAVPVDTLAPYAGNPRRGDVEALMESLTRFGQYRPIVARRNGSLGQILAGNHTYLAALALGWQTIACTWIEVPDGEAARLVAWDNRSSDLGGTDDSALAQLLATLPDLHGTGYSREQLDALLDKLDAAEPPLYGVVIDCQDEEDQVTLLAELGARYRVRAILS